MFYYFFLLFFIYTVSFLGAQPNLSKWPIEQLKTANTAINEDYLTKEEKNIFFILNLARINPGLFYEIILQSYQVPEGFSDDCLTNNKYITSLSRELQNMNPINLLYPNRELWEYAQCHAIHSGETGFVGHERLACLKPDFYSECCSYGFKNAIDIVIQLLIDYQVRDLGHRKIMLNPKQKFLGASIQPHTKYRYNAVLDFSQQ